MNTKDEKVLEANAALMDAEMKARALHKLWHGENKKGERLFVLQHTRAERLSAMKAERRG